MDDTNRETYGRGRRAANLSAASAGDERSRSRSGVSETGVERGYRSPMRLNISSIVA